MGQPRCRHSAGVGIVTVWYGWYLAHPTNPAALRQPACYAATLIRSAWFRLPQHRSNRERSMGFMMILLLLLFSLPLLSSSFVLPSNSPPLFIQNPLKPSLTESERQDLPKYCRAHLPNGCRWALNLLTGGAWSLEGGPCSSSPTGSPTKNNLFDSTIFAKLFRPPLRASKLPLLRP